jgi:hypothetical protein
MKREDTAVVDLVDPALPGAPLPRAGLEPALHPAAEPESGKAQQRTEEEKALKQEARRLRDAHRPLDSWERYRALRDALDEGLDLVDLADHKARFALVIMGALNVALFFVGARSELLERIQGSAATWLWGYLTIYVLLGAYFLVQAIESLRPRASHPRLPGNGEIDEEEYPLGLRFFQDVQSRDLAGHLKAWREIRIGQLNAELARQTYALAQINRLKYAALRRLYLSLKVMTLLAAGLVLLGMFVASQQMGLP